MGYSLIKDKNVTIKGIKSYLVDSAEDLATLPVSDMPGSTALVAGTKDTYTLNNSYEWVKEEAEGGGSGLPPVTSEDAGKVLSVTEQGEWAPETAPTELPVVSATDNGKVLKVNNGAWAKSNLGEWTEVSSATINTATKTPIGTYLGSRSFEEYMLVLDNVQLNNPTCNGVFQINGINFIFASGISSPFSTICKIQRMPNGKWAFSGELIRGSGSNEYISEYHPDLSTLTGCNVTVDSGPSDSAYSAGTIKLYGRNYF